MDIESVSGYEAAYYIGCVVFVAGKALLLAALILSDDATPAAKIEVKSTVSVLAGLSMMVFWYCDFHGMGRRPTEDQYLLLMTGWVLITAFSAGIIYYEVKDLKNRLLALAFGACLSVGAAMMFGGSIAFEVNGDNLRISSEWAIGLGVFVSSITTAISLGTNSMPKASAYDRMLVGDAEDLVNV